MSEGPSPHQRLEAAAHLKAIVEAAGDSGSHFAVANLASGRVSHPSARSSISHAPTIRTRLGVMSSL
jgi:hypothetical protein